MFGGGGGALQFFGEGMNWPGGLNSPPPSKMFVWWESEGK